MAVTYGRVKTWSSGDTLTAADLNAEFDNILSNTDATAVGAQSSDATLTAVAGLTITQGSLIYGTAADALAILAKGTARQMLAINSGATAPEWVASPQSVLTAAGDVMYASAANTLARLAKGSANAKLFMHASNDAPEWAAGIKIGTLTRAMAADAGDVSTTGVGFKPAVLVFLSELDATSISAGFDDGTAHYCIYQSAAAPHVDATKSIVIYEDSGKFQTAIVKSMDADGFTLTWAKTGAPASANGTIFYLALR